jgi:hypothetical protein
VLLNTARGVPYQFRVVNGRQGIEKEEIGESGPAKPWHGNPESPAAKCQKVTD